MCPRKRCKLKYVSFYFPAAAERRVSLMSDRESGAPTGSE